MPVEPIQIERNVFVLHYIDDVTIEEIARSHEITAEQAANSDVDYYVHILELSRLKRPPFNLTALIRIVNNYPQAFAVLAVNAPPAAQVLVGLVGRVSTQVVIEAQDSIESARERAHELLQQKQHSVPHME